MNSLGFLMAIFGSLLTSAAVKATAVLDLVNFKERETPEEAVCLAGTNHNEFSQTIASSPLEFTQTCPLDPGFQNLVYPSICLLWSPGTQVPFGSSWSWAGSNTNPSHVS